MAGITKGALLASSLCWAIFAFGEESGRVDLDLSSEGKVLCESFSKEDTFGERILKASSAYESYRAKKLSELEKLGVKPSNKWHYCGMIVPRSASPDTSPKSYDMDRYSRPRAAFDLVDIRKVPFDPEASFDGDKLWNEVTEPFGAFFEVDSYKAYAGNMSFIRTSIHSDRDIVIPISIAAAEKHEIWFNKKKLDAAKKSGFGTTPVFFLNLPLKAGENELVVAIKSGDEFCPRRVFFSPYADASTYAAKKIAEDFPDEAEALSRWDNFRNRTVLESLISSKGDSKFLKNSIMGGVDRSLYSAGEFERKFSALLSKPQTEEVRKEILDLFSEMVRTRYAESVLGYELKNVLASLEYTSKVYPDFSREHLEGMRKWEADWKSLKDSLKSPDKSVRDAALPLAEKFREEARKALLANPLLKNYPRWICVNRRTTSSALGLPRNWQGNTSLSNYVGRSKKYDDSIAEFDLSGSGKYSVLFKDPEVNIITDLDVDFDGNKILFSFVDEKNRWQMDEISSDGKSRRAISPRLHDGVDAYDGAYMPDGRIIFCYTACHVGVPCVNGDDYVASLYTMDPDAGSPEKVDGSIRQLTFEQDADWMPVVLENGRVMYTRWEYTDNSHYFSRILMQMNPDGTSQAALYGSNSYWPNSLFYCRQIPGDANKFVGIVSGHHGEKRAGELHLFDISKGTHEADGRVRRFPNFGRKYVAKIKDKLVENSFPKILHPYPLSENFIVCSLRMSPNHKFGEVQFSKDLNDYFYEDKGSWGIWLVDSFDNMTPIAFPERDEKFEKSAGGVALLEPLPLSPRKRPEVIVDKTDPDLDYGYVFLNDIYKGEGLAGVPRGTVKSLRVFEYFYCYRNMGENYIIGNEGSWDVKILHGEVPVESDGSAMFKVPANRPIAVQPLDAEGKALALMRSWFSVMPGEVHSCVGCHESNMMTPSLAPAIASRRAPSEIDGGGKPPRGFSFDREVQPILDQYCVGCHDGKNKGRPNFARGGKVWHNFPLSYLSLNPYIRRTGPESNQNMLIPLEMHADTSELVQMLKKGHHGVSMSDEDMRVLTTWIDLNVPYWGTWKETVDKIPNNGDVERRKFLAKYANRHDNPDEIVYNPPARKFQKPSAAKSHKIQNLKCDGFPFDAETARKKVAEENLPAKISVPVGKGKSVDFVLIPSGEFVMGSDSGFYDEGPARVVRIEKPFYMAKTEITNSQFSEFDPEHDSGHQDRQWKDHINKGYPSNNPEQSVVRVSWNEASEFCSWLGGKLGVKVSLPSEKEWEWAARAGSSDDFWYGNIDADFSKYENLADKTVKKFAVMGVNPSPLVNIDDFVSFVPRDKRFSDGFLINAPVGSFEPNPFGLCDVHGNVLEWTRDNYTEVLGGKAVPDRKTVRGGSWRDRPKWARVTVRRDYSPWMKVYNVGFRPVILDAPAAAELFGKPSGADKFAKQK